MRRISGIIAFVSIFIASTASNSTVQEKTTTATTTLGTDIRKLVDDAIQGAKEKLEQDRLYSNRRQMLQTVQLNHTSVKFTGLTEAIGESSNENLLAFNILLQKGVDHDSAIDQLFQRRHDICTAKLVRCNSTAKYRTINGTCNNLKNPMWGASFTQFNRIIPNYYADGINLPVGEDAKTTTSSLPNARVISKTLHGDLVKEHAKVTNMLPQFGQFLDHDITLTPEGDKRCCSGVQHVDCFPINIPANDTFYSKLVQPQTCMDFTRSTPFCFPSVKGVREQMNIITSYIDASNVYGSEDERMFLVRSFSEGKLRVSKNNAKFLPIKAELEIIIGKEIPFNGTFIAGDQRVNEMPALLTMHTLWMREHNRIAGEILKKMPSWTDEQIFQETRRLVISQMQNVVYGEFLPVLLGSAAMKSYGLNLENDAYSFYDASVDPTIFHSFATAAYRFGHTFVNGLVQLMRGSTTVGSYRIRDNFFVANQMTQDGGQGYNYILGGLMLQNAQNYDPFVTEDLTNFVQRFPHEEFGADLVARNIQRGRDHGLQPYMSYRRYCGLSTASDWSNTSKPKDIREDSWTLLQTLYTSPQDIDLFSGGLLEIPQDDALTGPTFNCLKALQFQRLKNGDRYFFTHEGYPSSFQLNQIKNIRRRTLGDIICENSNEEKTPRNVFLVQSTSNALVPCNSTERARLNFNLLIS